MVEPVFKCPEFVIFEKSNCYTIQFDEYADIEHLSCEDDLKVYKNKYHVTEIKKHDSGISSHYSKIYYIHRGSFSIQESQDYIRAPSYDMAKIICDSLNKE